MTLHSLLSFFSDLAFSPTLLFTSVPGVSPSCPVLSDLMSKMIPPFLPVLCPNMVFPRIVILSAFSWPLKITLHFLISCHDCFFTFRSPLMYLFPLLLFDDFLSTRPLGYNPFRDTAKLFLFWALLATVSFFVLFVWRSNFLQPTFLYHSCSPHSSARSVWRIKQFPDLSLLGLLLILIFPLFPS
ncbi:hypothetical protein DFS34DRAFT_314180 [Phlyctochytrium arcticum]|nr:hypothetical protein DFS34DRAFT_314180 [Phlyctochytrium arcticum]